MEGDGEEGRPSSMECLSSLSFLNRGKDTLFLGVLEGESTEMEGEDVSFRCESWRCRFRCGIEKRVERGVS